MAELFLAYYPTVAAYVALGLLILIQVLVVDVAAMRAGHVPGMPVADGHDVFLFRATRAHANTNETFGLFLLLTIAAMFLAASPTWTNRLAIVFVAARALHMLAYYADLRTLRSTAFVVALLCLIGFAVFDLRALD